MKNGGECRPPFLHHFTMPGIEITGSQVLLGFGGTLVTGELLYCF